MQQFPDATRPLAGTEMTAAQAAASAMLAWQEIERSLVPVLGDRGFFALYKRALHLASAGFPGFAALSSGALTVVDFSPLQRHLSALSDSEAAAASSALLHTFTQLLHSLIGESMTRRLVGTLSMPPSSGPPAQEIVP